jgi:hypothetical protein
VAERLFRVGVDGRLTIVAGWGLTRPATLLRSDDDEAGASQDDEDGADQAVDIARGAQARDAASQGMAPGAATLCASPHPVGPAATARNALTTFGGRAWPQPEKSVSVSANK